MKKVLALVLAVALAAALGATAMAIPAELSEDALVGTWPMDEGMYDPSLDGQGLVAGTLVFTAFEFNWDTFAITPGAVPSSLAGYTRVNSASQLTPGTWTVLTISGAPDYSYVLVMEGTASGGGGAATGGGTRTGDSNVSAAIWTTVALVAVAGAIVISRKKKTD